MSGRRFQLTRRDREVLSDLVGHRAVLSEQLCRLGHFGSLVRCNARMRRLREEGFVAAATVSSIQGRKALHRATTKAAVLVAHDLGLDVSETKRQCRDGVSLFQIEHVLRSTELRIAFHEAAQRCGRLTIDWQAEPLCRHDFEAKRHGRWQRHTLKPDGLLFVRAGADVWYYFVEVDLGHVSRSRFLQKARTYREYAGGVFQETYRAEAFAVLTVTTGEERMRNLATVVGGGSPAFYFTTFQLIEDCGAFGEVWTVAPDGDPDFLAGAEAAR
jgi:hypothetical protein